MERFTLGIDFGTESGRVMVVRVADGAEAAYAVVPYAHGVIDRALPGSAGSNSIGPLPPEWALQHPQDYLDVLTQGIPAAMRQAGITAEQVAGVGIDFTACTILPVQADGTPLCTLPEYAAQPHAWVKLWKHHAAQPDADRINELGAEASEYLRVYGGRVSSEWLFPKVLQMLREAPAVARAADRILEGGDWVVWQLTGREVRSEQAAGYKGGWIKGQGYLAAPLLQRLHADLPGVVRGKLGQEFAPVAARAGGLTAAMAARLGLREGTPVAVGNIDAHAAVPGCGVARPGVLCMIMGTSLCHMLMGTERRFAEGVAGVIEDGIMPGTWGYEAGQAAVGDLYAWFFRTFGLSPEYVTEQAQQIRPGAHGLVALDWWNGNRSVLMNADLTGLLLGCTLRTTPADIYRALVEATAFGTLQVIRAFEGEGVPIDELVACGGLAQNSPLVMQVFADVTNRPIQLPRSLQASGLGAAMCGAVAGGVYPDLPVAAAHMAGSSLASYQPDPAAHAVYQRFFAVYEELHDHFGRGASQAMQRLREARGAVLQAGA